jgi:hypothetical protein
MDFFDAPVIKAGSKVNREGDDLPGPFLRKWPGIVRLLTISWLDYQNQEK